MGKRTHHYKPPLSDQSAPCGNTAGFGRRQQQAFHPCIHFALFGNAGPIALLSLVNCTCYLGWHLIGKGLCGKSWRLRFQDVYLWLRHILQDVSSDG